MRKCNCLFCLFILLSVALLTPSCKEDKEITETTNSVDYKINEFIWSYLNAYYLWADDVPKLQSATYKTQSSFDNFLNQTADHEEFFYSLLYKYNEVDKWSWIVDDYTELENQLQGIYKTNGIDFRLGTFYGTNNVFGFVRYVMKGSPADLAGVKRGDLFTYINNTKLTMSNYYNLLFENISYTMAIDTIIGQNFTPTGRSVNLTAIEFQESPIYLDTVYTVNTKKVGYLVYNSFINKYNYELNTVFQKFKDKAIDELIIDLRYNSGGDEGNMISLASMIYSTNTSNVFMQTQYNAALQSYIVGEEGADYLKKKFIDKISVTISSTQTQEYTVNSLSLDKLYVITSNNTASAGEVLICGLKPYIPVILVGDTTVGKYVGSVTFKDVDSKGVVNTSHKWALQPIIMKVANKNGITDYVGGFIPDVKIREQYDDLKQLGDLQESLLKTTLNYINGNGQTESVLKSKTPEYITVADSDDAFRYKKGFKANPIKISRDLPKQ